jgi:hypothetical protein
MEEELARIVATVKFRKSSGGLINCWGKRWWEIYIESHGGVRNAFSPVVAEMLEHLKRPQDSCARIVKQMIAAGRIRLGKEEELNRKRTSAMELIELEDEETLTRKRMA